MSSKPPILVLVHPGSACGSADFNIGHIEARAARDGLCFELDAWAGGILVIDGGFSDELPEYPTLNAAIEGALERSLKAGLVSQRVMGDDPEQSDRAREFIGLLGADAQAYTFCITGTWYMPDDGGGCVGSVLEVFQAAGLTAEVSDHAVVLPDEEEQDEECDAYVHFGPI
jgi:hypothetical protein